MGWVRIAMGAKDPASRSHIRRLEGLEGDMGTNGIELGLAVGCDEVII